MMIQIIQNVVNDITKLDNGPDVSRNIFSQFWPWNSVTQL